MTVTNFSDINSGFKNITFPSLPASNSQGHGELIIKVFLILMSVLFPWPGSEYVIPLGAPCHAPAGPRSQGFGPHHRHPPEARGQEGLAGAPHRQESLLQNIKLRIKDCNNTVLYSLLYSFVLCSQE